GEQLCELAYLISHPSLFEKYDGMRKIKVKFENGKTNSAKVEFNKTLDSNKILTDCIITLTLNFDYQLEHDEEFRTLQSDEPDLARQSILLHELQHVLQALHNRPCGIKKDEGSRKADARFNALGVKATAKKLTVEETQELQYLTTLSKEERGDFFYYKDKGEIEARKVVRKWLALQNIRYIDPLTEYYGIDPDQMGDGGDVISASSRFKPYETIV
ncbi:MAG: hypothetical protein AABY22_19990, partial [Nanoarchaeota archaeon]